MMNTWVDLLQKSQEDVAICLHSKASTVDELCKKKKDVTKMLSVLHKICLRVIIAKQKP